MQLATIIGAHLYFYRPYAVAHLVTDNVGLRANLISTSLIEETVKAFPRLEWASCFASTIEKELALKPWCHTSTFEVPKWEIGVSSNFATDVRKNHLMNKYDSL